MAANNLSYSAKVCLTSALLSPGLTVVADSVLFDLPYQSVIKSLWDALVMGCMLTVPIGVCFYLITRYINKARFYYLRKKLILSISGVLLVFLPLLAVLLSDSDFFVSFTIFNLVQPVIYAILLIIGIVLYKLIPADEESLFYSNYKEEPKA